MSVREIVTWPNSKLRQESKPEPSYTEGPLSDHSIVLIKDLIDTMWAHKGAGIAAIQIGVPRSLFIVEGWVGGKKDSPPKVFFHPEVTWTSEETCVEVEGCLSFPETFLKITRPERCRIKARNEEGTQFEVEVGGMLARVVQHEYDHVTGKVFLDWLPRLKRDMVKKKLKKKRSKRQ
jgi:peptide deformylase